MKGIHGRESARTTLSKSERLLERLLEGDEEAFCDLLDRHAASMLRLAFLHCNSRTVAEEVVQETWLAVIDGLSGFEGGTSLNGAPERGLLSAQAAQVVRVEIDRLSPMQRVVITMRDIENWESGEVCEALGVSEHDQRVLLHRARSRICAALERHLTRRLG